ncbi:eukaryotic translation initiation factor 4E type 2 isoform X2 [Cimex lectularius]|uniref:eIF-4F 25 kDa subunit n=1 Tax=Cimex lectularius TaxID=79782 RepID=A0A8I6SCC9_CIMLE|nr:eukaryotic translation initiation factor 4E type 2 isoform X2 [Cimex lectularius]
MAKGLKSSDDSGEDESAYKDIKNTDLSTVPLEIPPGDHKLQYCYCLWYSRRSPGKQTLQSYDQHLKSIGCFGSVEQFWAINSHLARPSELPSHSDYHLFKVGIKPMWEDEANQKGGKWIVRLRKGFASRCWENLVLAILGEQFMVGQEICGAVVSIRFQEDIICVWNKTASDTHTTARIRDAMRRVLNLPPNTILEYKTHIDSLKSTRKAETAHYNSTREGNNTTVNTNVTTNNV